VTPAWVRRLWPRSLRGQALLTIALALLLAQSIGAILIYRAQIERRDMALLHSAAFRLLLGARPDIAAPIVRPRSFLEGGRGFRVERNVASPTLPHELRDTRGEEDLRRILADQTLVADGVRVVRRPVDKDAYAMERLRERAVSQRVRPGDTLLVAALHRPGDSGWLVTRVVIPRDENAFLITLVGQTLFIYLFLVGATNLVLGRITRPLAALTGRLERFARTRSLDGQLVPEGPADVRRLIVAHNAMESRISALLDEKDVMLGAIGHDLKTPLAALRIRIESVEDEAERAKMAATIEDIVRSLDDILSLARVGRPSDRKESTDLYALIAGIVEDYEDMGEDVSLADANRLVMPLRATWLRRAVRNLIGNALRYGARARVSLAREGGEAVIRVEDDGPGIPAGLIEAMLEPFRRGEPSRNTETGGAGLGLTLAQAIAEQHGGTLQLANRIGPCGKVEGLTATLRLPVA
jgi:signal transduction histidine kinase